MTKLKYLSLDDTQVSEIWALKRLKRLVNLFLKNTQVKIISDLVNLKWLETLSLSNTPVSDISVTEGLGNLRTLNLRNMPYLLKAMPGEDNDAAEARRDKNLDAIGTRQLWRCWVLQ